MLCSEKPVLTITYKYKNAILKAIKMIPQKVARQIFWQPTLYSAVEFKIIKLVGAVKSLSPRIGVF